jgi:mannitol/fructose-specific phosphotransferase system IIA component (Ntr-type)
MPHAAIDDFSGLVGCLGISRQGIIYEEGAEPVHFVFLLVSSSRDYAKYHEIQAAIARFMTRKGDQHRGELLRCQTPAEVAQLLGAEAHEVVSDAVPVS